MFLWSFRKSCVITSSRAPSSLGEPSSGCQVPLGLGVRLEVPQGYGGEQSLSEAKAVWPRRPL